MKRSVGELLTFDEIAARRAFLADLSKREIVFNGEEFAYADMTYKITAEVVPPGEWRGTLLRTSGINRKVEPLHKRAATENAALVATLREFARTRQNALNKHTAVPNAKRKQRVSPPAAVVRTVG